MTAPGVGEIRHCWFGPAPRRLAAHLHVPAGGVARAGVVICPPIGQEQMTTYWGLRRLAEQLVGLGFVVCRFDYSGTGDSAGCASEAPVSDWTGDIEAAVDLVATLGLEQVALVGLRLGAVLAGEVAGRYAAGDRAAVGAETSRIGPVVMWDPVAGRTFLREQQALFGIVFGAAQPSQAEVAETLGFAFGPAAAADLRRLRRVAPPDDRPALLLVRSVAGRAAGPNELVQVVEIEGQAEFVDLDSLTVQTPLRTIERIATWLDGHLPQDSFPLQPGSGANSLVLEAGAPWRDAVEERFEPIGPSGLLGVVTQPASVAPDHTVVFLGVATEPHFGPGRMWVELARSLAATGARAVRFDFRGVGDSPGPPGEDPGLYRPEDIDDVIDLCRELGREGVPLTLVGLCSGGYLAVEAALEVRVERVCLINPVLAFTPPEIQRGLYDPLRAPDHRLAALDPRRHAAYPTGTLVAFVQRHQHGRRVLNHLPPTVWNAFDRIGLQRSAVRGLERLASRRTAVILISTENDLLPFTLVGPRRLHRLEARGALLVHRLDQEDHSLFRSETRSTATRLIEDHCRASRPPARWSPARPAWPAPTWLPTATAALRSSGTELPGTRNRCEG